MAKSLLAMGSAPPPGASPELYGPDPAVLDFARRLVLAETLQALAARLAEVRQALEDPPEGGGDATQPRREDEVDEGVELILYCQLTKAVAMLLEACLALALLPTAPPASLRAEQQRAAEAEGCYRSELAEALQSSYIAEHSAATTLVLLRAYDGLRGLPASPALLAAGPPGDSEGSSGLRKAAAKSVDELLWGTSLYLRALLRLALGPSAASATSLPAGPASDQQYSRPLAALSRAAALGPCASYLTLAYGMSVLSYMDGGGTRGLPEDVRRGLGEPLRVDACGRLEVLTSKEEPSALVPLGSVSGPVRNCLYALYAAALAAAAASTAGTSAAYPAACVPGSTGAATPTTTPAATPAAPPRRLQLGWHTALGLAMRAARIGVRAAEEAAAGRTREQEEAALAAALTGQGTFRALVSEGCGAAVAVEALKVAAQLRSLLLRCRGGEDGGPTSDAGSAGSGQVDQGAEWWRLLAKVAPHLSYLGIGRHSSATAFGQCLREHLPAVPLPPEPLPPVASPAVASALAGGVLPCLERLIRRAAAAAREAGGTGQQHAAAPPGDAGPAEPTPELLALMALDACCRTASGAMAVCWMLFAALLAYGDPREAGALIATLGKALLILGDPRNGAFHGLLVQISDSILLLGRTFLDSAAARLEGGGALTPPERQLAGLLGAAAAVWLPEVSRALMTGGTSRGHLMVGLRWLPLLSCYSDRTTVRATAAAASRGQAAPAVAAEATGSGGWNGFKGTLFQSGEVIRMAFSAWSNPSVDNSARDAFAPWLAEAACTFAALRPEEAAASVGSVLRTKEVRALAAELKASATEETEKALEALAAQLLRWEMVVLSRSGGRGGGRAGAAASGPPLAARYGVWVPRLQSAAALLPASPAAARQLLGGCSNPACANQEGDSDAALPLRACAGCGGAASYCSRECQMAHWRSGHREACRGGAGGGGRGGGG
ncbi:hypothetical protein HYH03_018184 [Edaphochlamys debaryana]|uniref:phytol kinase n=1 Tax=Edaphochlamys debaryana TaxID=47281 RepID=A0A835XGZ9_9CHLO|nr:hypothetical protein HYH03_018184 [Edaphochlamys debaryana]|eukprot:KAG2482902.1 hypothetical protein HYH03_018184 [Edaphochlamys debaryana]